MPSCGWAPPEDLKRPGTGASRTAGRRRKFGDGWGKGLFLLGGWVPVVTCSLDRLQVGTQSLLPYGVWTPDRGHPRYHPVSRVSVQSSVFVFLPSQGAAGTWETPPSSPPALQSLLPTKMQIPTSAPTTPCSHHLPKSWIQVCPWESKVAPGSEPHTGLGRKPGA